MFDFESDAGEADMPIGEAAPADSDEFEDLGPPTDEGPVAEAPAEVEVDQVDEGRDEDDDFADDDSGDHPATEVRPADTDEEDLLAGSPDFIDEEAEEDEDLWFEKSPPKDFDFEEDK